MHPFPSHPAPDRLRRAPAAAAAAAGVVALAWLAAPAAGQELLRAPSPGGRGPATGSGAARPAPASTCRADPAWLDVDGRLGTVRLTRDGLRALVGYTRQTGLRGSEPTVLRVVDLVGRRPVLTVELGEFGQVTDIWPSHEGTRVWVAVERGGRILTVDSRTGELLMAWVIGETSPQSGAVSRRDRFLYVTNREAGTLTLINRATVGARTVQVGRGVSSVDVWERGVRTVWLANPARDELVAVSGRRGDIVARMESGGRGPVSLRVRPGADEVWVAHRESRDLVVVDAREHRIVDRIPLDGAPGGLAFSRSGDHVFVTLPRRDRVIRIDARSRTVIGPVPSGRAPAELTMAGCVVEASWTCAAAEEDPWLDPGGLPVDWVDDQRIVDGRMCGLPAPAEGGRMKRREAI